MDISSVSNVFPPSTAPAEAVAQPVVPGDQRALIQAVHAVNAAGLFGHDNELTFIMDRHAHRAVARLVNRYTHEVIRQIPDETVLRMAEETSKT